MVVGEAAVNSCSIQTWTVSLSFRLELFSVDI